MCVSTVAHSQGPGVPRLTAALPGDVVADSSVLALAALLAAVPVGPGLAGSLAAPAPVPRLAQAGPGDGVTQRPVLALASAAAVGPPVAAVARCRREGHGDVPARLGMVPQTTRSKAGEVRTNTTRDNATDNRAVSRQIRKCFGLK